MERRFAHSAIWAGAFAAVAALATLWIQNGRDLAGGLAFAINRLPRQFLLRLGAPDIDTAPLWNATSTGVFVLLVSFVILVLSTSKGKEGGGGEARRSRPLAAIVFGALIVYEVGYLLFGQMPRYRFGRWVLTFFLPWHLVALGLTLAFIIVCLRSAPPDWVRHTFWLLMFTMTLVVLFPVADSL